VAERLAGVRARLAEACRAAGRDPLLVRLVAVSKTQPAAAVREAYAAGQRDFGENYAQELRDKARELADLPDLRWHFVGGLQTNKVKLVVGTAHLFHALDSLRLAQALDQRQALGGGVLETLVEVNVGLEPQKHGVVAVELPGLLEACRGLPHLRVTGLMCIPPLDTDAESHRPHFRALRALAADHGLRELSMGMTDDFAVAIQEGATMVRVGTAIFGARQTRAVGEG
jgi:hypothetical protein